MASCVALTSAMISKTIASTVIDAHAPWRGGKGGRSYARAHDAAMALPPRAYDPEGSPRLAASDSQYLDALVHRARDRRRLHQGREGETGEQRGLGADVVAVLREVDQLSLLDLQQVQLQLPLQVILCTAGQARESCGRERAEDC